MFCRSSRKSTTQCSALPHQPCSPRPNIAQKEQRLPLLSCLAPIHPFNPHSAAHIHHYSLFILPGRLLISKIYASYHFSLYAPFRTCFSNGCTLCWKQQIKHRKEQLKPGKVVKTVTFAAAFSRNLWVTRQSWSNGKENGKLRGKFQLLLLYMFKAPWNL